MQKRIARQLKTIGSFAGRLAERRRYGGDSKAIASYAHQMVINKRTNSRMTLDVDEASLSELLTPEEHAAYDRLVAAEWARAQRKTLIAKNQTRSNIHAKTTAEAANTHSKQQHHAQAEIRQHLLAKGAVTIRVVAQRLGITVGGVRRLHTTGQLPSAGFVPVQYSRGKHVHLWTSETIIRYLNGLR